MIRTNLSTRPFYNVAAVRSWLVLGVLAALAITAFNVVEVLRYSNSNTELVTRASSDEARAADLRARAQKLRASVSVAEVDAVSVDARLANDLIDRRTFSWTELFNLFERTLPDDVRITAVRPVVDKQHHIVLTVNVVARSVDDVNKFMEALDATGAFPDLRSRQEQTNEDGLIVSSLEMDFQLHHGTPPSSPTPASNTAAPDAAQPAPAGNPGAAR